MAHSAHPGAGDTNRTSARTRADNRSSQARGWPLPLRVSRLERVEEVLREARAAGLSRRTTVSLEDVDHRRSQLWGVALFVMACLAAIVALAAGDPRTVTQDLVRLPSFRVGIIAFIAGVCAYVIDKEIHLRRLTRMLLRERALTASLAHEASHDPLTGLLNRTAFVDLLGDALERSRRTDGRMVGVLFIDLDHFKMINDGHGHEAGDQLLVDIASRLQHVVRDHDTIGRLGGDEFAVMLEGITDPAEVTRVADRITVVVSDPVPVAGDAVRLGASVGVAVSVDGRDEANDLLREADMAMYLAKRGGRSRFEIFEPDRIPGIAKTG